MIMDFWSLQVLAVLAFFFACGNLSSAVLATPFELRLWNSQNEGSSLSYSDLFLCFSHLFVFSIV